jgi:hypothetical protein
MQAVNAARNCLVSLLVRAAVASWLKIVRYGAAEHCLVEHEVQSRRDVADQPFLPLATKGDPWRQLGLGDAQARGQDDRPGVLGGLELPGTSSES